MTWQCQCSHLNMNADHSCRKCGMSEENWQPRQTMTPDVKNVAREIRDNVRPEWRLTDLEWSTRVEAILTRFLDAVLEEAKRAACNAIDSTLAMTADGINIDDDHTRDNCLSCRTMDAAREHIDALKSPTEGAR